MVTSPVTDPYSSRTMAMWTRRACMSRRSSATFFVSGTKYASRMRFSRATFSFPACR